MQWDYRDQLRQTDLGSGGTASYVYDASGQRVRKVWEKAPGLIEERLYFGRFEIFRKHPGPIAANTASLERETVHVMDDRKRIAVVETRSLDTEGNDQAPKQLIRYQFSNHLGSSNLELDEQAQIISYEEHAPYGSSTYQAVRSQAETPKRYRYTGKERDEESGLYYHGARYYASWIGRWISSDPLELMAHVNGYNYANCSPTCLADYTGMQPDHPEDLDIHQTWTEGASVAPAAPAKGPPLPPPTQLPRPSGPWDVDADRIVIRKVESGAGPWKGGPKPTKAAGNELARRTGFPPKTRHLGHDQKPHWQTKAGEVTTVRNEPGAGVGNNSSRGAALERPAVARAKAAGEYARVAGNDPTAPPGARRTPKAVPPETPVGPKSSGGAAVEPAAPASAPSAPKATATPTPPAEPPTTPAPEVPVVEAPPSGGFGSSIGRGAVTGAKVVGPALILWGAQALAQRNYDEAARLRDQYVGPPTQDQMERQRRAGWEFNGQFDQQGHPQWDYKPSLLLRLRDSILYITNPFDPIRRSGRSENPWEA